MPNPVAVLVADLHFTPATLELASKALRLAQTKAFELNIPLVIAGDTLDSKAIMRGECVNRLIDIFNGHHLDLPTTYVLVGNHDLLNEKGSAHSLEFLKPYVTVISDVAKFQDIYFIAYKTDLNEMISTLSHIPKGSTIVCHQGVQSAYMGHYAQDKTSLPKEVFADFRVISGHYHRRQDIKCGPFKKGNVGLFSYIGNPYTQNFGEAPDPVKGYQVLYSDGSLQFHSTLLRKHVVVEHDLDTGTVSGIPVSPDDLIWLKVTGTKSKLDAFDKKQYGELVFGHDNFKFTLTPTEPDLIEEISTKNLSEAEMFDTVIDSTAEPDNMKSYMKTLWRETLEDT